MEPLVILGNMFGQIGVQCAQLQAQLVDTQRRLDAAEKRIAELEAAQDPPS